VNERKKAKRETYRLCHWTPEKFITSILAGKTGEAKTAFRLQSLHKTDNAKQRKWEKKKKKKFETYRRKKERGHNQPLLRGGGFVEEVRGPYAKQEEGK